MRDPPAGGFGGTPCRGVGMCGPVGEKCDNLQGRLGQGDQVMSTTGVLATELNCQWLERFSFNRGLLLDEL